jgi:hypothetical protein
MALTTTDERTVDHGSNHNISLSDIEGLADRLWARARSRLFNDQPDLQADLLLAGRLLTRWL